MEKEILSILGPFMIYIKYLAFGAILLIPGPLTVLSFYPKATKLSLFLFLSMATSIILISWVGLILAQCAIFSLGHLFLTLMAYSLILIILKKPHRISFTIHKPSPIQFIFLTLLFVGFTILYFRPHEYLTGHWDPGTYLNTGFHLAKSGTLEITDPLLSEMSWQDQKLFAPLKEDQIRTPGFYMKDPYAGVLIPQFYHLYPVWIALFFKLFGVIGALCVNPLFALFSLWSIYILLSSIKNKRTAVFGVLLLGFCVPQIWNARFATSEILAQYFILSGIYTLSYLDKENPFISILSASSFAMAILTRTTSIIILPILLIYFITQTWLRLKKKDLFFIIPIVLGSIHLYLQSLYFTKAYIKTIPSFFSSEEEKWVYCIGIIIFTCLIIYSMFRSRIAPLFQKAWLLNGIKDLIIVSLFSLTLYAFFIRPQMGSSAELSNLIHISWFLSPIGIATSLAGVCLWLKKDYKKDDLLLILLTLFATIFFIYKKRTYSSYPWALKRYTPIILPAFAIYTSYFLTSLKGKLKWLSPGLLLLILIFPAIKGEAFIKGTDQKGMHQFIEKLSSQMEPNAIYLFDRDWIAVPLQTIYDHQTFLLPYSNRKYEKTEKIFINWIKKGKKVFYISDLGRPWSEIFHFVEKENIILKTDYLEPAYASYPTKHKKIRTNFGVYELVLLEQKEMHETKYHYEIGQNPYGLRLGFDKARYYEDFSQKFRWTSANALIKKDVPNSITKACLVLKSPRVSRIEQAHLTITLNDSYSQKYVVPKDDVFREYCIELPAEEKFDNIQLSVNSFNLKALGLTPDGRDLGVMLKEIMLYHRDESQTKILMDKDKFQGLYQAESIPHQNYWGRWTKGKAKLIIPWPSTPIRLTLRMSSDRVPEAKPALITLRINNQEIVKDYPVDKTLKEHVFEVPSNSRFEHTSRVILVIESTTWDPYKYGIKKFPSRLGVLLDWIKIESIQK